MRTKASVHTLSGHTNAVATLRCQAAEPQIITGMIHTFQVYSISYQHALLLYTFHIYCDSCFVLYIQCFSVHFKFIVVTFNSVFMS